MFTHKRFWQAVLLVLTYCSASGQRLIPISYTGGVPPAGTPRSYTRIWDAAAAEQTPNILITRPLRDVKQSTQYFDGLGRPLQSVVKQGSLITNGVAVDMIKAVEYDVYGRESFQYLPSPSTATDATKNDGNFKLNPFAQQAAFYNSGTATSPIFSQGETYFYGQTVYEASPLNRVLESSAPGNNWSGTAGNPLESDRHSIKMKGLLNTPTDAVRIWTVSNGAQGSFSSYSSSGGSYAAGLLFKQLAVDEQGKQVITFTDREGRLILKKVQLTAAADNGAGSSHTGWLCTYYLYDDLNNLSCVISPKGVELIASTWALTDPIILAELCFRYEYDQRNRMIIKKVPGADPVYLVYDNRDRLVMAQDGNLRTSNKWIVTKYDNLNRPAETGLWADATVFTTHLTNAAASSAYPTTSAGYEQLSVTHYDDYAGIPGGLTSTFDATWASYFNSVYNTTPLYAEQQIASSQTRGMATWTQTKIIGSASTFLYTVNIYDEKGRVIQVKRTNITGGTDISTTQYNWAGKPLIEAEKQDKAGAPVQTSLVITQMTYDDLGRVTKTEKRLSNTLVSSNAMSAYATIASLEYDALGQLKKKTIGNKKDPLTNAYYTTRQPVQELVYDYNIRGWLLGMNRDYLSTEGQTSDGKYFGFELGYDKLANKSGENFLAQQWNGNIAGMLWKSDGNDIRRKYDFGYDAANRMLKADFEQQNADDHLWNNSKMNFAVKVGDGALATSAYDANGNIKRLQQWGMKLTAVGQVDDLTYNYSNTASSNKLLNVGDAFNDAQTKLGDFRVSALNPVQTKIPTTADYAYDLNGNLVKDLNKDIVTFSGANGITYNYLNLPEIIMIKKDATTNKGTITYTYDATGNKLKKVTVENASAANNNVATTTTTSYIGGFVYESKTLVPADANNPNYTDRLLFIGQEEGRIRFKSPENTLEYDYMLNDHLGNVHMVLSEEVQTIYYPAATLEGTYSATGSAQANSMVNYEKQFYNIDNTKITLETAIPSWPTETTANTKLYYNNNGNPPTNLRYPAGCTPIQTDGSTKLYKLNATANRTGLEFIIKVMAGDKIDILGKSYFLNTTAITNANSTALNLLTLMTNLLLGPANAAASKGLTAAQLNTLNTSLVPTTFFRGANSEAATTVPKAYINYILFDEQFKYAGGNFSRVGVTGTVKDHWQTDVQLQNINVVQNGYIFVYVSNESNMDVFFDNLQVVHKPGPILEETHYYPFGLTMAGISSKAVGKLENKYQFNKGSELQSKEFSDGSGLEMYATSLRSLDPQIGRWWQIDPKPDYAQSLYSAMNNNPISFNDPLGDTIRHSFRTGFLGIFGKKVTVDYNNGKYYNARTNTEYTGKTRNYQNALLNDLTSLSNNSTSSSMMSSLVSSSKVIQIKNGGSAENGGAQFEAGDAIANPGQPLIVNYSVGKSFDSRDVNQGGVSAKIPGFVGLGHELAHVEDYLKNGNTNFLASNGWYTSAIIPGRVIGRTEIFATDMENRLRSSLGLPLREFYSADKAKGLQEGRILNAGTRTNTNINFINNGKDALGNLIPVTY